ncbi:MAG: hypothetical protein WB662_18610 [Methyloceanibacter sp.]
MFAQLSLRQKLAVVRRRIAYMQKRGRNEPKNYNYVTAADIAGAVGDIPAELGSSSFLVSSRSPTNPLVRAGLKWST